MALSADDHNQCAMKDFIPGLELASKFYEEAVRPILESDFFSPALLGGADRQRVRSARL
jgi:hypothetical protein